MSSGLTTTRAAAYVDDSVGTTARTAPTTPMKLVPVTATGTAGSAGTPLGSTTPGTIAFGAATGTPPVASSTGTTTIVCGATGTVTGLDIQDSAGTPVRVWFGPLTTSRAVVAGDSLVFAAGSVTLSITSP